MSRANKDTLLLFIVAIIWGSSFIFVDKSLDYAGTYTILAMRFGIASLLMALFMNKRLKFMKQENILLGIMIGLFLFGGYAFQTLGLEFGSSTANNAFLTSTSVAYVPAILWIVKGNRPAKHVVLGVALMMAGAYVLTGGNLTAISKGDAYTMIGAMMFGGHIALIGININKKNYETIILMQFLTAAIMATIFMIARNESYAQINSTAIMMIVYLGIMCTMVCFFIQNKVQITASPNKTAVIVATESLFATIFAVFFGLPFTASLAIGGALIFASVIAIETQWKLPKRRGK